MKMPFLMSEIGLEVEVMRGERGKGCCAYFILIKLGKVCLSHGFGSRQEDGRQRVLGVNDMQSYYGWVGRGEMRSISSAKEFPRMLNSIC